MCRWLVYVSHSKPIVLADLLTRPSHSIVHQSFASEERTIAHVVPAAINADGFGVAWYPDQQRRDRESDPSVRQRACLFRSVLPAWNNLNLWSLAEKVSSPLIFAHIRAASAGSPVTESNCHPFTHAKFTFMHNGGIGGWKYTKAHLLKNISDHLLAHLEGSADSEHIFLLLLSQLPAECLAQSNQDIAEDPTVLLTALLKCIEILVSIQVCYAPACVSSLNFALTDGHTTVVSRLAVSTDKHKPKPECASLYYSVGSNFTKCSDGEYRMRHTDKVENVVIIASEALSPISEDWVQIAHNSILLISAKGNVLTIPVDVSEMIQNARKSQSSLSSVHACSKCGK